MAKAMSGKTKEEVGVLLRSLLLGSSKEGIPIHKLQYEYKLLVGEPILHQSMGYRAMEDLLRDLPDVVRLERSFDGVIMCKAIPDDKSVHIHKLSRLKPNKSKKEAAKRRIHNPGGASLTPYRRTSHNASYGRSYPPKPQSRYTPNYYHNNYDDRRNQNTLNQTNRSQSFKQDRAPQRNERPVRYEPPPRFKQSNEDNMQRHVSNPPAQTRRPITPPAPLTPPPIERKSPTPTESAAFRREQTDYYPVSSTTSSATSPKYSHETFHFPSTNPAPSRHNSQDSFPAASSLNSNRPVPVYDVKTNQYYKEVPKEVPVPAPPFKPTGILTPEGKISPELVSPPALFHPKPESCVQMVDNYAYRNSLMAKFKTINTLIKRSKKSPLTRFLSTLTLGDRSFQSYPVDKQTPEEANEEAARKAVEELQLDKMENNVISKLPFAKMDTEAEKNLTIERILEIVAPKSNGIWHSNVQKRFEELNSQKLPTEWLDILKKTQIVKIETVAGDTDVNRFILYPRNTGLESPLPRPESSDTFNSASDAGSSSPITEIRLPEDDQWEIYVSHIASTMDVVFRLVDYGNEFDKLTSQMEEYYKQPKLPINNVVVNEYYCVADDDNFPHRVQITSVEGTTANCYFVDLGDVEMIEINLLKLLPKFFLGVPFQAISCQLTGIEYLEKDNETTEKLNEYALGKTLIAEVTSREDVLSIILYDTSTDVDQNINKIILEYALTESLKPSLPKPQRVGEAFLCNVTEGGDISLQPCLTGLTILNDLISDISAKLEESVGKVPNLSTSKMYAVKKEGEWRRALIIDTSLINRQVMVNFIDYRTIDTIPVSALVEIEEISDVLTKFPAQAVLCCLHEVPFSPDLQWSERAKKRLLDMVPKGKKLSVKVIPNTSKEGIKLTQVQLFKRNEANELISLNQTLALFEDLFDTVTYKCSTSKPLSRPNSIPLGPEQHSYNTISPALLSSPSHLNPYLLPMDENRENGLSSSTNHDSLPTNPLKSVSIPNVGSVFDVVVILAVKPDFFFVQSRSHMVEFKKLFDDMQSFYNDPENLLESCLALLKSGNFYAVKHEDGFWYRGWVQQIPSMDPVIVVVYLVDYGEFIHVELSAIQQLWNQFRNLPFQAIKAKLSGVEPVNYEYDISHIIFFQEQVKEKPFVSIIKSIEQDKSNDLEGYLLSLSLIDTSSEKDVYVSQTLIDRGYAKLTTP